MRWLFLFVLKKEIEVGRNWFSEYVDGEVPYEELEKMASEGKFREWNYEAFDLVETGYEDVEDDLAKYTAEKYKLQS